MEGDAVPPGRGIWPEVDESVAAVQDAEGEEEGFGCVGLWRAGSKPWQVWSGIKTKWQGSLSTPQGLEVMVWLSRVVYSGWHKKMPNVEIFNRNYQLCKEGKGYSQDRN